jgi:hypothetical protein
MTDTKKDLLESSPEIVISAVSAAQNAGVTDEGMALAKDPHR